uniref:Uncharacterized protein n=1 Tax=Triticum urartu TaxID=4572 RepID=A0A8R7PZ80_TRIUA
MKRVLLCFFRAKWQSCLNVSKVPLNQVEKWNKQRENETFAGPLEIDCLRVSSVAFVSTLLLTCSWNLCSCHVLSSNNRCRTSSDAFLYVA